MKDKKRVIYLVLLILLFKEQFCEQMLEIPAKKCYSMVMITKGGSGSSPFDSIVYLGKMVNDNKKLYRLLFLV